MDPSQEQAVLIDPSRGPRRGPRSPGRSYGGSAGEDARGSIDPHHGPLSRPPASSLIPLTVLHAGRSSPCRSPQASSTRTLRVPWILTTVRNRGPSGPRRSSRGSATEDLRGLIDPLHGPQPRTFGASSILFMVRTPGPSGPRRSSSWSAPQDLRGLVDPLHGPQFRTFGASWIPSRGCNPGRSGLRLIPRGSANEHLGASAILFTVATQDLRGLVYPCESPQPRTFGASSVPSRVRNPMAPKPAPSYTALRKAP
jgi:hypothetical protein